MKTILVFNDANEARLYNQEVNRADLVMTEDGTVLKDRQLQLPDEVVNTICETVVIA